MTRTVQNDRLGNARQPLGFEPLLRNLAISDIAGRLFLPLRLWRPNGWGQGIAGLFMAFDLFWSGISGKNKDAWYDRVLHVIGGLLILGAFIGGAILLLLEHWKH